MTERCENCPRLCGVDRNTKLGFCAAPERPQVSAVCIHKGEEPPLSGIHGVCNVFFSHCNLQCVYCQNYNISRTEVDARFVRIQDMDTLVAEIERLLPQSDNMLGLVSPSHYVHLVPELVQRLRDDGFTPTVIYNTNAYDRVEVIRQLSPYIDIYLPDFKYASGDLASRYSHAPDYPERAKAAITEMYNQKGSSLPTDNGLAFRGMIIRHLVLPGQVENSLEVLEWIATNLSTRVHLSLMAQYFPPNTPEPLPDQLSRPLSSEEYQRVVDRFYDLGFEHGWLQELSAQEYYRPDFASEKPFC